MRRRSFIAALVATFATPAKMLAPVKPMLPMTGLVHIADYMKQYAVQPVDGEYMAFVHPNTMPLFKGEIGQYHGIKFIEARRHV